MEKFTFSLQSLSFLIKLLKIAVWFMDISAHVRSDIQFYTLLNLLSDKC
jgi:hypothetical protein